MTPHDPGNAERLTWDQICSRFPNEWVVLVNADWENVDWENDQDSELGTEFGTALVLGHYKRRKEASPHIKAAFKHYREIACYWTGEIRGPIPRFVIS